MRHLGDITKISGYEIEIPDVVCGGSPCQDLSVAGKRAGLQGERSGLYMEQVRIVKELRDADRRNHPERADEFIRPRYMLWENVPGAFSSGEPKGADFAVVIEEAIKIVQPNIRIEVPEKGWQHYGCYFAEDGSYSIAWSTHDAQFWGVPQRRKRICMVCDFNGTRAAEVCFTPELIGISEGVDVESFIRDFGRESGCEVSSVTEGLSRDSKPSIEERKGSSTDTKRSFDGADTE